MLYTVSIARLLRWGFLSLAFTAFLLASTAEAQTSGSLSGLVARESDEAPLSGIYVYAMSSDLQIAGSTVTGADGRYTVSGLSAGNYLVFVSNSQGYANEYYDNVPGTS